MFFEGLSRELDKRGDSGEGRLQESRGRTKQRMTEYMRFNDNVEHEDVQCHKGADLLLSAIAGRNDATPKIRASSQALHILGLLSHGIPARIECLAGAQSCGQGRSVLRSVAHNMFRLLYAYII